MTDFVELSRQLIAMRTKESCLLRALDIFTDNATIYTVYEDVACVTLASYLSDQPEGISWRSVRSLFRPLFDTVSLLNAHGIVHRGISPDTILVAGDGTLRLKGVSTAAARAINSEVKAELFSGYAAPEQYEKCTGHGEWTDVYALSAVLYRTLTGTAVIRADLRTASDALTSPSEINAGIPVEVSAAIMRGLAVNCTQRIRTVRALADALYSAPSVAIPFTEADKKKSGEKRNKKGKRDGGKLPVWLIVLLVSLPIMLILFFAAYSIVLGGNRPHLTSSNDGSSASVTIEESSLSSEEESSEEESSAPSREESAPGITVDNFVGKYYEDIEKSTVYGSVFTFTKTEVFDDTEEIGIILKQDVEEGATVPQGTEIHCTVSKGARFVSLPPLTDDSGNPISLDGYRAYLEEAGLTVSVKTVSNPDYESGTIIELDHEIGSVIDRAQVTSVTIFVAK